MKQSPSIAAVVAVGLAAALISTPGHVRGAAGHRREARRRSARTLRRFGPARALGFEPNQGQTHSRVRYLAHATGYDVFVTDREVVLTVPESTAVRIELAGASERKTIEPALPMLGRVNYLIGRDPAKWRTGIPTYGRVVERGVWDGIDVAWYGNQQQVECDFIVAPGAEASAIELALDAPSVALTEDGSLTIAAGDRELRMLRPTVYQEVGGSRRTIDGRYRVSDGPDGRHRVKFEVAAYDLGAPLVIDPVLALEYSTYLGDGLTSEIVLSTTVEDPYPVSIAVDADGSAYVAGNTHAVNFPTQDPYQPSVNETNSANGDAFVTKFSPDGSSLVFSTYLGGMFQDNARGIAVDSTGSAYVVGVTLSSDFPTTANAYKTTANNGGIFLTKFAPDGRSLAYSTYLGDGQGDGAFGVAVDSPGHAYVVGSTNSTTFPTVNPYQDTNKTPHAARTAFVTKFSADGQSLDYSTFLGGSISDVGKAIAVDSDGQAYVTGSTLSADFPTVGAFQDHDASVGGYSDAFVTKLAADGRSLVYSTYLGGGAADFGLGIALDANRAAYVTGATSSGNFPLQDPIRSIPGGTDAFLTKLAPDGRSLAYSTLFGAGGDDIGLGVGVDSVGRAVIAGYTSSGIVTVNGLTLPERHSSSYGFVAQFAEDGRSLRYATLIGGGTFIPGTDGGFNYATGVAVDPLGDAYVAGITRTIDFPTVNAFQSTNPMAANGVDAFVSKLVFSETGGTTTSTTTTTIRGGGGTTTTTTSTTPPCTTPRCIFDAVETSATCAGQTIPAVVIAKITKAEALIQLATTSPARKAGKLLRKARRALSQAGKKVLRASRGRKPKISTACAAAVKDAADRVAADIGATLAAPQH